MIAISRGHSETDRGLISENAYINNKNNIGNTPIILSVLDDNTESVKLLLDAGADISIRNNKREQAIELAKQANNKSIIALLDKHKNSKKIFGLF